MPAADVVIAGGGIVGSAVAWALARQRPGRIVVVDVDLAGLYASSELNAGGARATWWQPVNIATCAATLEFFRANRDELGFREDGYLWLYDDAVLYAQARQRRALQNGFGLAVELLDAADIPPRFPIVDRALDELVGATFSPRDGLVNPNAVRRRYRREAEALGVQFLNRHYIDGVHTDLRSGDRAGIRRVAALDVIEIGGIEPTDDAGALRRILTAHHVPAELREASLSLECGVLVNCLGAWSPLLSARLGIADPTEPVRRQISLVDVRAADRPPDVDLARVGMIVDPSNVYWHPEGPHFLAGYSIPGEPAGYDFAYDGATFFERHVWPPLARRCSLFERCRHVSGWAGLYAVTPDRSGIAGAVDGYANLFEAHSFTGRGVMQSYGIGVAIAELIAQGRYGSVDLSPLTRARFGDCTRWVTEELHI